MRMNRKAVTDLPIKLLVISIILSVSVPIVMGAADTGERNMDLAQMESEAGRIGNAVASVYYSQDGYERCIDVDVPEGCSIVIGGPGDDGFGIHLLRGPQEIGTHWMEKPIVSLGQGPELFGHVSLRISMDGPFAEVDVL